jgi:sigma-54 dependent transcriptional regulator, acetoin dehydrogenase operon transcriptional activator AcoR
VPATLDVALREEPVPRWEAEVGTGGDPTLRKGREAVSGPTPARALLHIVHTPRSPSEGRTAPLFEGDTFSLGRNVIAPDILLDDPCASRLHARIAWDGQQSAFRLEDAGSANGTFVNGQKVAGTSLSDQDILRIGDSLLVHDERRVMDRLRERATSIATSDLPVLIVGETGTGKEVMARFIHETSGRRGQFVAINCGALPRELAAAELFGHTRGAFSGAAQARPGLFASAAGGTLFLDEIGDLPLDLQPALLRALQEKTVRPVGSDRETALDVRILAATNVDLESAIGASRFRSDLYARLAQVVLALPALRERRFEIPALARSFARMERRELSWTADALEVLLLGEYRYNVRELRALVCEFLALSPGTEVMDLQYVAGARPDWAAPVAARGGPPPRPGGSGAIPSGERERLARLLSEHDGNVSAVAKELGKPRAQIYRWLNRFGLSPRPHRR